MCADLFDVPISFSFKPSSQKTHLLPLQAAAANLRILGKSEERILESAQKAPPQASHARRERRAGSEVRGPIPSAAGTRAGLKLMGPISQYHR